MQADTSDYQGKLVNEFDGHGLDLKISTGPFFVFLAGIRAVRPFPTAFSFLDRGTLVDFSCSFQTGFSCQFAVVIKGRQIVSAEWATRVF